MDLVERLLAYGNASVAPNAIPDENGIEETWPFMVKTTQKFC